MHGENRK